MLSHNLLLLTALFSGNALATSDDDSSSSDFNGTLPSLTLHNKEATASTSASFTTCNPLKTSGCSADKALATSISNDFKSEDSNYLAYRTPTEIFYTDEGLKLTLAKRFDNPSLVSDFYIMFGKVEVLLKSASGQGIISSFYLQSDDLDEIDLEWFGSGVDQMQSNFFSKGDTTTYDRGQYHTMSEDPRTDYHNYTLDWNEDSLTWYIDGTAVRTLQNDTSSGYPQSPMRLFFGIWAGGDSTNEAGTIEWAGGATDYSDAPFSMYMKSLVVSDYSTGSEYSYGDDTGSWSSIVARDGKVNGRKEQAEAEFASLVSGGSTSDLTKRSATTSSSTTSSSTTSSMVSSAPNKTSSTTSNETSTPTTLITSSTTSSSTTVSETTTTHHSTTKKESSSSSTATSTLKSVSTDNGALKKATGVSSVLALALVFANMF